MRVATDFTATATTCPPLDCGHADTCLPDYWTGHHLPHISVPVWRGMTLCQLRRALQDELNAGAVAGSADWESLQSDAFYRRAVASLNRLRPATNGQRRLFLDLDPADDDSESVYAYFCFRDAGQ